MNFKKYHVSKNLCQSIRAANGWVKGYRFSYNGQYTLTNTKGEWLSPKIPISAGTEFTISAMSIENPSMSVYFWNDDTYISPLDATDYTGSTFTAPEGTTQIDFAIRAGADKKSEAQIISSGFWVMVNVGSTPLPYEPYGNTWHDIPHYIHNTSTDTITTPADIYANDTTATVGLQGNMEQSGTPTPQNPIQPQECGERTGNLFDNAITTGIIANTFINQSGAQISNSDYYISAPIDVEAEETYTWSFSSTSTSRHTSPTVGFYDENNSLIGAASHNNTVYNFAFTTPPGCKYIRASVYTANSNYTSMLVKGDVSQEQINLPFIPYGYKIPILNNSQTTNVYLGEVQTTRKIYKTVLTGQETWTRTSTGKMYSSDALDNVPNYNHLSRVTTMCSHYKCVVNRGNTSGLEVNELCLYGTDTFSTIKEIYIYPEDYATAADFATYLQQQYAAGTPVTVWYVLNTPQTAVVNEPLRKIGDYVDTISGISIPTIAGANTLSIGTTLQPSEVTVNYKGWHPVQSVHVYPDSSWMPTSWEEFRKAVRSGKAQSLYPVGTKLYENWGDTTSDAWIIVDYPTGEDYLDSDLAQQGYTNRVMLMEEKLNYLRQFDAIEAWLYVETAIPAGTYRFTIPNYDASYGGNKTYIFTSTANVPVGGQLTLTWAPNTNPTKVQGYSSSTSTSDLFNVSITEWDGTTACTDLGTIKLAQNDPDSTYGKLNHIHRARYGSNNYYQSGYRQWLNTNASANWWTPTNVFDRPYDNRTNAGRLNVMNSNMKSVLATPTVNCITNNLFEYPSLDGTTFSLQTAYTVKDKLFPVTHSEINLSSSPNVNSVLDYYVNAQNADRIKYRKDNGNAYYWWMRTPTPTNAHSVRIVYNSGTLSGNTALSTGGSAAACIIQ